jgi:hypothetical protein
VILFLLWHCEKPEEPPAPKGEYIRSSLESCRFYQNHFEKLLDFKLLRMYSPLGVGGLRAFLSVTNRTTTFYKNPLVFQSIIALQTSGQGHLANLIFQTKYLFFQFSPAPCPSNHRIEICLLEFSIKTLFQVF